MNKTEDVLINLEGVNVFREDTRILDNINWKVRCGQQWVVLGANGSGKSFLMNIISSYLHPSGGKVSLLGFELGKVNVWKLRKKIGVVSDGLQASYAGSVQVIDVVCSGFFSSVGLYVEKEDWMDEKAKLVLESLQMADFAHRPFRKLSHGEQKRVLIARALVFDPDLLILDEPCNGLDIPSREYFLETLSGLVSGGTNIVYVTHHVDEIMPFITHVLLLKNGQVVECGKKEDVLREYILNRGLGYSMHLVKEQGRYFSLYRPE